MLSSTGAKQKPALDENSFQQMLAAAYVVQQHKETPEAGVSSSGTSHLLNVIAEIQSQIRNENLNIADSAGLISEKLLSLAHAEGVSISLVDNGYLDCVGESGRPIRIPGSSISSHSLVATEKLKSGQVFESSEAQTDLRVDGELCKTLGVGSLVAAPVLRFGEIAGLVEVRWAKPRAFAEPELRTCRLMSGLVTGTLERSIRIGSAKTEAVRDAVQVAETTARQSAHQGQIETVINPEATVIQPEPHTPELIQSARVEEQTRNQGEVPAKPILASSCRMCGRDFAGDEQFCGFCSMPRPVESRAEELQSKWASMWFMQRAQGALAQAPPEPSLEEHLDLPFLEAANPTEIEPEVVSAEAEVERELPKTEMWPRRMPVESAPETHLPAKEPSATVSFPFDERSPTSERVSKLARRHWRDAILASVVIALTYGVVTAWPKSASQSTWFQELMVRVGVMHPSTKVFAGAPDSRVWLDVHTQLYYCSGEDLYGKTPDGEFTTQYNAQSDGYVPASNVTCP